MSGPPSVRVGTMVYSFQFSPSFSNCPFIHIFASFFSKWPRTSTDVHQI